MNLEAMTRRLEEETAIVEKTCLAPSPGSVGDCENCRLPLRLHRVVHVEGLMESFIEGPS